MRKRTGCLFIPGILFLWAFSHPALSQVIEPQTLRDRAIREVLTSVANQHAAVSIQSLANVFITQGKADTLWIEWYDKTRRCIIRYARKPGGGRPENYPYAIPDTGWGEIKTLAFADLGVGIYYSILQDVDQPDQTSMEFRVFVQPPVPVRMLQPVEKATLDWTQPVFSWEPVGGMPYYLIMVSQGKLELETDPATGEIIQVKGVNLVWQAFTTKTTIEYGELDLAGTWPVEQTAPLIPGETYHWLVFSAFGPDLKWVAWELYPLNVPQFRVGGRKLPQQPHVLSPSAGERIADDEIRIRWNRVPGAERYRVLLFSRVNQGESRENTVLYWQHITVDTAVSFYARDRLPDEQNEVQVIAESADAVSASAKIAFRYQVWPTPVEIWTVEQPGGNVVPFASISIFYPNRVKIPFDFFTGGEGGLELNLPAGELWIHARAPGYLPAEARLDVAPLQRQVVTLFLQPAPYELRGRVQSPDGQTIPFARITALTPEYRHTNTDGLGYFVLSSQRPITTLRIAAPGFSSQTLTLPGDPSGKVVDVGVITLGRAGARLSGSVLTAEGLPLRGVRFRLLGTVDTLVTVQTRPGRFAFPLQPGSWEIRPILPGYRSEPEVYRVQLTEGEEKSVTFVFYTSALLQGRVFSGGMPVSGVKLSVLDENGRPIKNLESDNFGMFHADLRSGTFELTVQHPGYAPYRTTVRLQQGKVTFVDIYLQKPAIVRGRVLHAETQSPLAQVAIINSDTDSVLAVTDAGGRYLLQLDADHSPVRLDARLRGFRSDGPRSIQPAAGDTLSVNFTMTPAAATIQGQVLRRGLFVPFARVIIKELNIEQSADEQGRFTFEVDPGSYTIQAMFQCLASGEQQVSVAEGETVYLTLELQGDEALVTGRVYDLNGTPLPEATILVTGEQTYTARSDSSGAYQLCLPPGPYYFLVSRIGYRERDTTLVINPGDSLIVLDFYLQDHFARIDGRIVDPVGAGIEGVQVLLTNFWQQKSTVSDPSGRFRFENLYPGESTIVTRSDSFFAPPVRLILQGGETKQLQIQMVRRNGYLAGWVLDGSTGSGLDSAVVVAQLLGSSSFYTAYSSAPDGRFRIEALPLFPGSRFRLLASKSGFVLKQPLDSVAVNSEQLELILLPNNGSISGKVLSSDEQEPISGAVVEVVREGESRRVAVTDQTGSFVIAGLVFTFSYRLTASHPAFFPETLQVAAPANVELRLRRKLAHLRGVVVSAETGEGMVAVAVLLTSLENAAAPDTVFTREDGTFAVDLRPGEYQVQVHLPGYFVSPPHLRLQLAPLDTSEVLRFEVEKQVPERLRINGPSQIVNSGEPIQYQVEVIDRKGRIIQSLPGVTWWAIPGEDTARIDTRGRVFLTRGFAGLLTVGAVDTVSGMQDRMEVLCLAPVDSGGNITLFNRDGMEVYFPAQAVEDRIELHLETAALNPLQRLEAAFRIWPPLYRLVPQNVVFLRPVRLSLPLPPGEENRSWQIRRWDHELNAWEDEPADSLRRFPARISGWINRTGAYAVVSLSAPLRIEYLEIRPNPFSPEQINETGKPGAAIRFSVTSDQAALPLVTARIYTMQGNLVAILANQKPVPKGPNVLNWDGRTQDGYLARNGRYILKFTVQDGRNTQELVKSLVLIQ